MVNNTDCVALRLSRKLGTSSRRDDCARRTCDTETKMRSTERKCLPPEKISSVKHGAAVGERTESERREDENDRARTNNRAREMYLTFVCFECSRCVRECACSEALRFAFKR